jgi:hypothetical protein
VRKDEGPHNALSRRALGVYNETPDPLLCTPRGNSTMKKRKGVGSGVVKRWRNRRAPGGTKIVPFKRPQACPVEPHGTCYGTMLAAPSFPLQAGERAAPPPVRQPRDGCMDRLLSSNDRETPRGKPCVTKSGKGGRVM